MTDKLTYAGHMLDKVLQVDGETVIDLELRGNREDLFGILGIAREVAALFDVPINLPQEPDLNKIPQSNSGKKVKVEVQDTELINRFFSIEITDLKVGPSPKWLEQILKQMSTPAINNVVDVTNYIMFLTAQPLHAFDRNKINQGRLILRQGDGKLKFTTFEGTQVTATKQDLIASDPEKCLGLLGVIGEKYSGVGKDTTAILLEGGNYNQPSVRRSSRRHKLRTDAALRLEKNIDPLLPPYAVKLCTELICKLAQGKVVAGSVGDYEKKKHHNPWKTILFTTDEVKRLGNMQVSQEEARNIFKRLDLPSKLIGAKVEVQIPWRRSDIEGEADLVEEVLRVIGYENIPSEPISNPVPKSIEPPHLLLEEKVRDILVGQGFKENVSDSFISQDDQELFFGSQSQAIKIVNPTSPETALLRTSLLPAQIKLVQKLLNLHKQNISWFEIGKVYWETKQSDSKSNYQEEIHLSGAIVLGIDTEKFYGRSLAKMRRLLNYLGIWDLKVQPQADHLLMSKEGSTSIYQQQRLLVQMGLLRTDVKQALNIQPDVFLFDAKIDDLLKAKTELPRVLESDYPPVIEDLTFMLPSETYIQPVIDEIYGVDKLINKVDLVDSYEDARTFRIYYQSRKKSLSDNEVEPIRMRIVKDLEGKFKAKLKGEILTATRKTEQQTTRPKSIKDKKDIKTEAIYYSNPYQKELECSVLAIESKGNLLNVILDKTVFYPQGGGQPSDHGMIGKAKVKHVLMSKGQIIHQVKGDLNVGDKVKAFLDWERRYKYMKIHTAGHLIHDAFMTMVEDLVPIKADHGDNAYLEYQGELKVNLKSQLERLVDQYISDDLPVTTKQTTYEDLVKDCPFVPQNLPKDKPLRVIKINNFPTMPDGGVHVKSTQEIGSVVIESISSFDNKTVVKYRVLNS